MAFLDKLSGIAKNIGDLAGETIEITKLNSKINSEKNAIDGVYRSIGESYYQKFKGGDVMPPEIAELCAEIDVHKAVMDEARAEIERIKTEDVVKEAPAGGVIECPACAKAHTPGTKFCQECGAKVEVAGKIICPCGAEVAPGVKFCQECGAKVEAVEKRICACGAEVAPGIRFCSECGAKFE